MESSLLIKDFRDVNRSTVTIINNLKKRVYGKETG